ncbi:MAG: hypothetical protein E7Z63_05415 [Thermoplasmata archaeon]|nr:hypothetical protein [Thermoplasmata archaeon]
MHLPLKTLLLKYFLNGDEWEDVAIESIMKSEGIDSDQWRWNFHFWVGEFTTGGLLEAVDHDVYAEGTFAAGKIKAKLKLTEYGRAALEPAME